MGRAQINLADQQLFQDHLAVSQVLGYPPASLYYLGNGGSSTAAAGDGTGRGSPFVTLAAALLQAGSGDAIYVLPGHAESFAATIAFSRSGVAIVGGGIARNRPAFTCFASAAVHGITLSGNNNRIHNIRVIASDTQTTGCHMHITGTDNMITGCVFEHGAGAQRSILMTAAHRTKIDNCEWLGTAAGPDVVLAPVSSCNNCRFTNLIFDYRGSTGLDSCAIKATGDDVSFPGGYFDNIKGIHMDIGLIDLNGSGIATTVDSLMTRCYAACGVATSAAAAYDLGSLCLADCWWNDAQAASSAWIGAAIPPVAGTAGAKANYPTAVPS